ncbi:pyocin activator PrtN family protein [Rhodobium orientis]|uniref:pyocin activator PrtN family protein n=1 Tax=Rhodobium orientis TaxID=34017 RepID=UPI000DAECDCB|nr:pyocin activator PrtN family protein [Rhodobium orientis]
MSPNTTFLLLAQHNGKAIVPIDEVRRGPFSYLTLRNFLRILDSGYIALKRLPVFGPPPATK